jgi:hypothetical protein
MPNAGLLAGVENADYMARREIQAAKCEAA